MELEIADWAPTVTYSWEVKLSRDVHFDDRDIGTEVWYDPACLVEFDSIEELEFDTAQQAEGDMKAWVQDMQGSQDAPVLVEMRLVTVTKTYTPVSAEDNE